MALAAITLRSEYVIAEELLRIQRARGRFTAPGTVADDLHFWLVTRGWTVTPWNIDADEPEDAGAYAERIRTKAPEPAGHTSLAESVIAEFPDVPTEQVNQIVTEWQADKTPLHEWIAAHPVGTFLIHVDGHYLAARDGRVIAGDTDDLRMYANHAVIRAERVSRCAFTTK